VDGGPEVGEGDDAEAGVGPEDAVFFSCISNPDLFQIKNSRLKVGVLGWYVIREKASRNIFSEVRIDGNRGKVK